MAEYGADKRWEIMEDKTIGMMPEEYYGHDYTAIVAMRDRLRSDIDSIMSMHDGDDIDMRPVVYHTERIKSPASLDGKLERRGFPTGYANAVPNGINDIIGARIICAFNSDVYDVRDWLLDDGRYVSVQEKDYIAYPKPNGYRSLHLIMRTAHDADVGLPDFPIEVQLRTIAMDFWATLEHRLKYKKDIEDTSIIEDELQRCADEIASVDIDMMSIRDMINYL